MTDIEPLARDVASLLPGDWTASTAPNNLSECLDRNDDRVAISLEPEEHGVLIRAWALPGGPSVFLGGWPAQPDAESIRDVITGEILPLLEDIDFVPDGHCINCRKKIRPGVTISASLGEVCSYRCYDQAEGEY